MSISRDEVLKMLARCRLTFNNKDQLDDLLEYSDVSDEDLEKEVLLALTEHYKGVSNGYLSEIYEAITGSRIEVVGKVYELFKCPCCYRNTLTELYDIEKGTGYDICDYCGWEDDGTTDVDINSSVNKGSITEYRNRVRNNPNFYIREKWLTK